MNKAIVLKVRKLMLLQTKKNGAPAWGLTEIVIRKGRQFAKTYKVDENLILTSLYLAHTMFSVEVKGKIQKNHEKLSVDFVMPFLKKWKVSEKDIEIIRNSILSHHNKEKTKSLEAEVMKNAECFKFLTVEGIMIFLHHLGQRGLTLTESIQFAKYKAGQKLKYISLKEVKIESAKNYKEIISLLDSLGQ